MLRGLVTSKNVERILLFLLVNGRCYATQLQRIFNSPLSPLQKALERLENADILKSRLEGKTRLYEFNLDFPLFLEVEAMLKKAYTLLDPREKKDYYFVQHIPQKAKAKESFLLDLWKEMQKMNQVSLEFHTNRRLKGKGKGKVEVKFDESSTLIYQEKGVWSDTQNKSFVFSNCFRWTLNRIEGLFTLEHLRLGPQSPVFLFHLTPVGPNYLESVHAHLCGKDTYFGLLILEKQCIRLIWRILGPRKNDEIHYIYSP